MVVSTIYDKDLGAKVFQVRDSERYTNSTQISLEVEYNNNHRSYVDVTLTARVDKQIGKSSVAFYCDDVLVGIASCLPADRSVIVHANVEYGYHRYYAKYLGNAECLSSKSGIVELTVDEPNLIKTFLSINVDEVDGNNWVGNVQTIQPYIQLFRQGQGTKLTGKTITYSIVDHYNNLTATTSNQAIDLTDKFDSGYWYGFVGEVTIVAHFEGDEEYFGCDAEFKVYVGYDFTAKAKYPKIGVGDTTPVTAELYKPDGTPVQGATLTFRRGD